MPRANRRRNQTPAQRIAALENSKAFAWAQVFSAHRLSHTNYLRINHTVANEEITNCIPTHLVNEFAELLASLKKEVECPVCFDVMTPVTLKITMCGHKVCTECFGKILQTTKKCPICRKKFHH